MKLNQTFSDIAKVELKLEKSDTRTFTLTKKK